MHLGAKQGDLRYPATKAECPTSAEESLAAGKRDGDEPRRSPVLGMRPLVPADREKSS